MNLSETRAKYHAGALSKPQYIELMYQNHARLFEYSEFIRDTDIASIEIRDRLVTMTSRATGIRMICDPFDKRLIPIEILNFGLYESVDARMIFRLIDPGALVFDIGANVGWYSMNIARLIPGVKVHAFEPIPATFGYLKQNTEMNSLSNNIELHNFGFSNREQKLLFHYYPEGSGNASAANLSEKADVQRIYCDVKTLDGYMSEIDTAVDFIKCDVEGAELSVFEGGIDLIRKSQPIIFTEMLRKWAAKFGYHPNDIIALLDAIGYQCFTTSGDRLKAFTSMNEATIETNFFFLHTEKHAQKILDLAAAPSTI